MEQPKTPTSKAYRSTVHQILEEGSEQELLQLQRVITERLIEQAEAESYLDREWSLDMGNSSEGPVGLEAQVVASSAEEAVEKLKRALPPSLDLSFEDDDVTATVCFGPSNITIKHIL